MNLAATLRVALLALRINKMRSALTMLGIIIGVAAVIVMIAVGNGAQARVEEQIKSLGSNIIMVLSGSVTSGGARGGLRLARAVALGPADAAAVGDRPAGAPGLEADQENAKKVTKLIRDEGPKSVKSQIQGDEVRVSSKSRDDLLAYVQMEEDMPGDAHGAMAAGLTDDQRSALQQQYQDQIAVLQGEVSGTVPRLNTARGSLAVAIASRSLFDAKAVGVLTPLPSAKA